MNKLIDTIDKQIESIEKSIEDHIASDPAVHQKVKGILKIKGIGMMTIATLLGETNGFLLFKNAPQLVSYSGYDIIENQSGKHKGKTRTLNKETDTSAVYYICLLSMLSDTRYHRLFNCLIEQYKSIGLK